MFAVTLVVIGIGLLCLFFLGHHRRSRLQGARKKTHLVSEVAPEPLGETLDHAEDRIPGSNR
jgi:hypothetical protein